MKQDHPDLSVRRQCSLLSLARSGSVRSAHDDPHRLLLDDESRSAIRVESRLFQRPALMIVVNPLFHGV